MLKKYFSPAVWTRTTGKEGFIIEVNDKREVIDGLKFTDDCPTYVERDKKYDILEQKYLSHVRFYENEIGYWLPKDTLKNNDMVMITLICMFSFIIKPKVKITLEEADFADQEFRPVWVGKNLDSEPQFWLWYHKGSKFNYSLDSKLGEKKYYLPKELQDNLKDLNRGFLNSHHHTISPNIVSEKVVEVLKPFKDIKFYPIEFI